MKAFPDAPRPSRLFALPAECAGAGDRRRPANASRGGGCPDLSRRRARFVARGGAVPALMRPVFAWRLDPAEGGTVQPVRGGNTMGTNMPIRHARVLGVLAAAAITAGCVSGPRESAATDDLARFVVEHDPVNRGVSCMAPMRLRNTSNTSGTASVELTYRGEGPGCQRTWSRTEAVTLGPNGTRYLGCSRHMYAGSPCVEHRNWRVVGR